MVVLGIAPDRPRIFRRYAALSQEPFKTNSCCVSVPSQSAHGSRRGYCGFGISLQLVLVFRQLGFGVCAMFACSLILRMCFLHVASLSVLFYFMQSFQPHI